jgi:lysozyme
MFEKLRSQIEFEEGKRLKAYVCTAGHKTIGIGHNLDAKPTFNGHKIPGVITDELCRDLFESDINEVINNLDRVWPFYKQLDDARRDAILNMAFQLGYAGLMKFKKCLLALESGNWEEAKKQALDSSWAKQTPKRANRVAEQLRTGVYYLT